MRLTEYYFHYLQQLSDGTRQAPEGICLPDGAPMERAIALQQQIQAIGIPEFVRRCAAEDGTAIPQEVYDAFSPAELTLAAQALAQEPPQIQEPDGPRNACEVLIDCCMLDERLLRYLIDILRREDAHDFQRLALVTTRRAFTQSDFLAWLASMQTRADREELICATLMDACLDRLCAQGETELIAALLCGDRTTFELFRCEAPELCHLPEATYAWYEKNYLTRYYPFRYILKYNHIHMEVPT